MIRTRDLKVWFVHHQGLLREMMSKEQKWVRAVDGVSFDVKRGEVFCLVGESGCGKTTTGKTLLQLEEATEGDVFFEMPDEAYEEFQALRVKPETAENAKRVEDLRRQFSLTWKEANPWTNRQRLLVAAMVGAATYIAFLLPAVLLALLPNPFDSGGIVFAYGVGIGLILGTVGAMPPSRPWSRTPGILGLLGFVVPIVDPILIGAFGLARATGQGLAGFSAGDALSAPWSDIFAMLIALTFSFIVAYGVSATLLRWRAQSEGLQGIKMRGLRKRLHLIFQDPYESLNPKQSIYEIVSEPLRVNHIVSDPEELAALVGDALNDAGLRPPEDFMFRFPHEVSGGQRQRVSIAAALALQPDFIVADEPVSMLDVSIRTDILQLMMELRRTRGLTYLFITHDLSLAWVIADHIAVMYLGKIVEQGTAAQVIRTPKHPYTRALISVVPSPDPRHKAIRTILRGERPDPIDIPTGCRFHPRCPVAFERCGWNASELEAALVTLLPTALPGRVGQMMAETPTVLRILAQTGTPEDLAESLRALFATKKDEQLVFRGVSDVAVAGGQVVVTMHEWSEPLLVEVGPGNSVACHLVGPMMPEAAPLITS